MNRATFLPSVALLLCVLVIAPWSATAQVPDTTSAWLYFPLKLGHVWEYRHSHDLYGTTGYERQTIVGDTLIGGRLYFLRLEEHFDEIGQPTGASTWEVRFDTLTASVKAWWVTDERTLSCPLDADFESEIECPDFCQLAYVSGGYDQTVTIGQSTVMTAAKHYDTGGCEAGYSYAAGLGEYGYGFWFTSSQLVYARIDGVEYGAPFPVGTEEGPTAVPALHLAVHPNPVESAGTVRLALTRPAHTTLAVYDVLGRRVALLHDGALVSGSHAFQLDGRDLPADTYLVRATGAGGAVTARAVLR